MNKLSDFLTVLPKDKVATFELGTITLTATFSKTINFGEDTINNIYIKYYPEFNVYSLVYMLILPTTKKILNIKKLDFIDSNECETMINMFAEKLKND